MNKDQLIEIFNIGNIFFHISKKGPDEYIVTYLTDNQNINELADDFLMGPDLTPHVALNEHNMKSKCRLQLIIDRLSEISNYKKTVYETEVNRCIGCGIDMGDCNPRQYCCKTYCPNILDDV
jgi:hypothetical protein